MGCFGQKSLLKTGAEKSRQVLWVFNKGRFVSGLFAFQNKELECCVNHMFQFSQPTFFILMRRAWKQKRERFHEIDSFAPSLPIDPRASLFCFFLPQQRFHSLRESDDSGGLDGRQPWSAELSCQEAWWWWVRRGKGEGGGWQLLLSGISAQRAGEWKRTLICSMSRALCARGAIVLAGTQRLVVSSGPLNEAFVISLRATREGKCSSAAFCWQELSEACRFLTDSCPVTASTKLCDMTACQ